MTIRRLLDLQVQDVIEHSLDQLADCNPASPSDIMQAAGRCVSFSPTLLELLQPHRDFLFKHVYWHPDVNEQNQVAVELMKRLFLFYVEHPDSMGSKARARIEREGLWRTACDYVSGMTDRYAMEEVERHGLG